MLRLESWSWKDVEQCFGPRVPRRLLPLHLPSASFAGQQSGQSKLPLIGYTGEYNASMQAELGASMAERQTPVLRYLRTTLH